MATESAADAYAMIRLFMSFILARVIYVAAKLGIADLITSDGTSVQALAAQLHVHPDALSRILHTLAGLGILHQGEHDVFSVTPLGKTLCKDSPQSVRDYAIYSHEFIYEGLRHITESVRTGAPVFDTIFGMPFYEYFQAHPEHGAIFHAGMGSRGRVEIAAILEAYDFSACRKVVDVGGGNGALLSAIVATYDQVSGVLFDQGPAIAAAQSGRGGPLPQCELVAGDFFEGMPAGGDTYMVKRVLCDWPNEKAIHILRNCRRAMANDGRLLIIDPVIGPPLRYHFSRVAHGACADRRGICGVAASSRMAAQPNHTDRIRCLCAGSRCRIDEGAVAKPNE